MELDVEIVSVELPDPLMEAGLKAAVAPLGSPETVKETEPLNPPIALTVAANVVMVPGSTVWGEGFTASEKLALNGAVVPKFNVSRSVPGVWNIAALIEKETCF